MKCAIDALNRMTGESPSTRRVWIEIRQSGLMRDKWDRSPSTRRVWIEIQLYGQLDVPNTSPSTRRVWIEICRC